MSEKTTKKKETSHDEILAERFESLEKQLGKLTSLLAEQADARTRYRRKITLRLLLGVITLVACVFAWYSSIYRASRRQASAVDQLVQQGVFVDYELRESFAIDLLPGTPEKPSRNITNALGVDFFRSAVNVSTQNSQIKLDKKSLLPAIAQLSQLKRLRLKKLVLRSADLSHFSNLKRLESLDISRTGMDNGALPWLPRTKIKWLDVSHTMLGDRLLNDLSRCPDLQNLNLERTTVTDNGLQMLYGLKELRYINLKRCPVTLAAVKKLSDALPSCMIDYEPLVFTGSGQINHAAIRRQAKRFGQARPYNPVGQNYAVAPTDYAMAYPVNVNNSGTTWAWPAYYPQPFANPFSSPTPLTYPAPAPYPAPMSQLQPIPTPSM